MDVIGFQKKERNFFLQFGHKLQCKQPDKTPAITDRGLESLIEKIIKICI